MIQNDSGIIDPFTGVPIQTTALPPLSNTLGAASPVFKPDATQNALNIYGSSEARQNSLGLNAPLFNQQF